MTAPAMHLFEHSVVSGDKTLTACVCVAGQDIVITVGGGSHPHVGAIVLAQPHPSTRAADRISASISVLTVPPHKEEPVARPIAEAVCRATGRVTVVTAGVHEDALDRSGIEIYLQLAGRLAAELALRLGTQTLGGSA